MNEKAAGLDVVYLPIEALKPYPRNARTHSDRQVEDIAASIQRFGFVNPVLLWKDRVVIAGHGRIEAAKKLGLVEVPTIELPWLTEAQRQALTIADNRISENAGWNKDLLSAELASILDLGESLKNLGFTDAELAAALSSSSSGRTDQDEAPPLPPKPVSSVGDLWVLGNHRVLCGDSLQVEMLERLCAGQKVDMWLTDPPYNVGYEGKTKDSLKIKNDEMKDGAFRKFLLDAYSAADSVMKPGAVFYVWHADSEGYNFRGAAFDAGWNVRQCLVWKKNAMVLGRQDYQWQHEPCLYGWKDGAGHLWASDRKQTTILEFDRPSRNSEHPTMKPVALFEYLMLNNTKGGDLVLDSFGGSGTTVIAAEKNGRHARAVELDPRYCDVIIKRWQDFTGRQAALESGETFEEAEKKRL